jgi:murein L,D-transpeptidase YafK
MADQAGADRKLMARLHALISRLASLRTARPHPGYSALRSFDVRQHGRAVPRLLLTGTAFAFAAFFSGPASLVAVGSTARSAVQLTPDAMLASALQEIAAQRFDRALEHIDALLKARPNFRLAHLIRGDLLIARARPLSDIGSAVNAPADRIADLREEAVARLRAYRERPPEGQVPRYLMKLKPEQQHAIVVDTNRSRLYLYRNEGDAPRLVADYYVSSGKLGARKAREGDLKTPIGVYHVTASLPPQKLPDFYGSGAFPINYPNDWDRRQGRDGHGIWLHGTPSDTFSRPPRASDGCVVLANSDLDAVAKYVQVGLTPVIISEGVEWVSTGDWSQERDSFLGQFEKWRSDWESLDTERYLQNYSRRFTSDRLNYDAFAAGKRAVNANKEWVKVGLSELTVFRNPGHEDLVVVTFRQDYRSSNLSNTMKKRQYWTREGNRWRIVYEGAA